MQEAGPSSGSRRTAEEGDTRQDTSHGGTAPPEAGTPPQLRSAEAFTAGCPLAGGGLSLSAGVPRPGKAMS